MIKSKNSWWNIPDSPEEDVPPLSEGLFKEIFKDFDKKPPEFIYFTRKATKLEWSWYKIKEFFIGLYQDITMKRIIVTENYWSKLLCAFLNIPALTLGSYIFLGCYQDRYETLLHETTNYFQNRTIWWYIRKIFKKLILRKEK